MKNKYHLPLLVCSFLFVVLVSGCIQELNLNVPRLGVGDALSLKIDTEGKTTYDSLEPFLITVMADNVGEFPASNIKVRLEGYDGITYSGTGRLSELRQLSPQTLDAPNKEKNMPGGTGFIDWSVVAPYVPKNSPDRSIILTAEAFYDYKSILTSTLVVAKRNYIENIQEEGKSLPVVPSSSAKNGPISLSMDVPKPYVKLISSSVPFRIKLTMNNQGSGKAYNSNIGIGTYDYLSKITITVPAGLTVDLTNCDFELIGANDVDKEKTLLIDETHKPEKLRLIEGGMKRVLNCNLNARDIYVGNYNTFTLTVNAYYTYLQDVTTRLVIKETEETELSMNIVDTPYDWTKGSQVSHGYFKLYYQGQEIKEGISKSDVYVTLGSGSTMNPLYFKYDSDKKRWDFGVSVPSDIVTGSYDLKVAVNYQGQNAMDLGTSVVNVS